MSYVTRFLPAISPHLIDREKMARTVVFTSLDRGMRQPTDVLSVLEHCEVPAGEVLSVLKTSAREGTFHVTFSSLDLATCLSRRGVLRSPSCSFQLTALGRQVIQVRVHWLPDYVSDSVMYKVFGHYGEVTNVTREVTEYKGTDFINGVRRVTIEMDECMRKVVPHMLDFECGQKALITMFGRPPLCLRCRQVGHLRRSCPNTAQRPHEVNLERVGSSGSEGRDAVRGNDAAPARLPAPAPGPSSASPLPAGSTPAPAVTPAPAATPVPGPTPAPVLTPAPAATPAPVSAGILLEPTLPPPPSPSVLPSSDVPSPPLPLPPSGQDVDMLTSVNVTTQGKKRGRDKDFITPNQVAKKVPAKEALDLSTPNMFAALFPSEAEMDSDGSEPALVMDLPSDD